MNRSNVKDGMTVYSSDGDKLGRIIRCDSDGFLVEKGFFFRKDYLCRYEDVESIQGDDLRLSLKMSQLQELPKDMWQPASTLSSSSAPLTNEELGARSSKEAKPTASTGISQETSIPVIEEELEAEKTAKEAGRVRIHKEVTTETKHVEVPVTKEEVYVERVPVGADAAPGEATFKDADISVPVYEEEVEIKKRPVVREEVRVSKTAHEEQRVASAQTRREDVSVEKEGKIEKLDTDKDPNRKY